MTIAELPKNTNLGNLHVKIPESHQNLKLNPYGLKEGFWKSQWGYDNGRAGIWFNKYPGETKIYPVFLNKLSDCLNWEIIL